MIGWVVDSALALAWGLPDEASARADRFLRQVSRGDELWVPAFWWHDLAGGLLGARRRSLLSEADALRLMELYRSLPLETDHDTGPAAIARLGALASRHGVSAHDAAYLDLAARRGLALATADRRLIDGARRAGVVVIGN